MSEQRFEDILDECIDRMQAGESWQQVIASYPQHAAELMPALKGAEAVGRLQWSAPSASARRAAERTMLNEVAATGAAAQAEAAKGGVVMGVAQWFRMRPPVARVAAVGAAAVMFGAVTMGAAAATGNAPQPVRSLFGVSDSVIEVEFTGTIVSIEGNTLTVDANGDVRTVVVTDGTRFGDDDDDARSLAEFAVGDFVEVEGKLQADNTVVASRLRLEIDDDVLETETPDIDDDDFTATPEPTDEPDDDPTPSATEDDADDDDDNSGPGNGDDDIDDDDNSGPGSGDDDIEDDSNSGPGSGDDDIDDDDNSGPGSGSDDDEPDDDNSGPGSGSDDDEPDDDISDSGSDDEPDDD